MQATQSAVTNNEYRNISIAALVESGTNPRKRFDQTALEELAASFKTQGILAPLLVRELEESKYEVVAGARRLRAARIAELENLPVRVVKLTDAEAIEAQCVENLQRQDIHPLEEALGFRALLELGEPAYSIATIAARTAKSEAYIYGRIRLADLIPPVAEAFLKDQITIGHALLIAKLPAAQQQEAFTAAFRGMWTSDGNTQVLIPVRELAVWIEANILLQLASVPFDKQDETLVPEAGSCANCPKRTGFNKLLFPDVQKDSCKLCGIRFWFWGWGAGEGAVPLPRPSAIEEVLTTTAALPLSSSDSPQEVQLTSIFAVQSVRWDRCPVASAHPLCRAWLTFQSHRGLAKNTLDAYSQGLEVFLRFLSYQQLSVPAVTRVHIGAYLASLQNHNGYLSNATVQQRLTVLRLFYTYLVEEGVCQKNPTAYNGGRALVPRHRKLPWVPNEGEWHTILLAAAQEPIRNRVMLTFAYDAGLRREELCSLCTQDIDPSRRTIWVRAENTKGRRDRVVPYSAASGVLLAGYLDHRRTFSQKRGPLFLSESRRNYSAPISIWSWSKIVLRVARCAGVPRFTTHTLRHLCLTDLARAGWDIHEIATFAGHRSVQTTLLYIHLSGRDLAQKLAAGMAQIHAQRTRMLAEMTA